MTNATILGIFRTHVQKQYQKGLEMKDTHILNILEHLLFSKPAKDLLKISSKRHPV